MKKQSTARSEADKYNVALDHFPEFASEIGVFMSCYALVESYVHKLISKTTGIEESDAFLISGSFMSVSARIDLLELLTKKRNQTVQEVAAAKYFIQVIREVTALRNTYAHGTYSLGFEGGSYSPKAKKLISISSFVHDAKRKAPKKIERDLDAIRKDVARIKFITCELHGYLYRDEIPDGA